MMRWLPLLLASLLGLGAAALAVRVQPAAGNRAWVDAAGGPGRALAEQEVRFGRQDGMVVALFARDVLAPAALAWQAELGGALAALPGVAGVDGLAGARDVVVDELGPAPVPLLAQGRERILAHPLYAGLLVAPDGRAAALLVRPRAELDDDGVVALEARVRALLAARPPPEGGEAVLGGLPVQQQAINRAVARDQGLTVPLSALGMLLVLFAVLRDWRLVALVAGSVASALAWSLAAVALAGHRMDALLGLLPPLVMGVGVATGLHLVNACARHGVGAAALRRVGQPLILATLTTVAGVGGLWWGAVPAVRDFAPWAALGVVFAALWPLAWITAGARLLPAAVWTAPRHGLCGDRLGVLLGRLASACVRRRRLVLLVWSASLLAAGGLCLGLRADADLVHALPADDPVRQAHARIDRELTGTMACDLLIDLGRTPTADDLAALAALAVRLRADPGFAHVLALTDVVDLVRAAGDPRPAAAVLADLRLGAREVVIRFLAAPGLLRIEARQHDGGVAASAAAARRAVAAAAAVFPGARVQAASGALLLDETTTRLLPAVAGGLLWSMAANAVLLLVFLRDWRIAFAGLVLSGVPLLMTYALLPPLGWRLDIGVSMIACVALGIIMDDAIHIAYALHREGDPGAAVREAGPVLSAACLALSLAFAACVLGGFAYTRRFGILLAAAFVAGLVVNLTLAPALVHRRKGS